MDEPAARDVGVLVSQAGSGDAGALHTLIERYLPALEAYVGRHAGEAVLAKESRADLVQSTCREVLQGLARGAFVYRGEPQFRQWLYQAALHKIQMKARGWKAQRRDAARDGRFDSEEPDLAGSVTTPSGVAMDREEKARFDAAMSRLEPDQRRIVEWAHVDGLAHQEIAERLGVTEAHSRVLLSRALAQLARLVAGRG